MPSRPSILLGLIAAGLAGCVATPPSRHPAPARVEPGPVARRPPLVEETLGARPAPSEVKPALPPSLPRHPAPAAPPAGLAEKIGASTAPHEAAALRLVDQAADLLAQDHTDAAMARLEQAMTIDPNNAYACYFLGESHRRLGHYDQAIAFAEKTVSLGQGLDAAWLSRVFTLQGRVYEAAGRFPDARQAFRKAIDADARNDFAFEALSRLGGAP